MRSQYKTKAIAYAISAGLSNKEIAEQFDLKPAAVRRLRDNAEVKVLAADYDKRLEFLRRTLADQQLENAVQASRNWFEFLRDENDDKLRYNASLEMIRQMGRFFEPTPPEQSGLHMDSEAVTQLAATIRAAIEARAGRQPSPDIADSPHVLDGKEAARTLPAWVDVDPTNDR